jgi:Mrr N-terminal domain
MKTVDLSDPTYKRLLKHAESFEDSPETVVKRLLDLAERANAGDNVSKNDAAIEMLKNEGGLLPEGEYWVPILEILAEAGGKKRGSDVIAALGDRLADRLSPRDYEVLTMGEVRWSNRARFARLRMKERGLISSTSPRGIWELTAMGREFLSKGVENDAPRRGSS